VKVLAPTFPSADVQQRSAPARRAKKTGRRAAAAGLPGSADPLGAKDFGTVYDDWFEDVSRWIRALGGPDADRDDIVQEVFMVVRRRLVAFKGDNLGGWLYRITQRQVRDFRRRIWVKHIFSPRRVADPDTLPHGEAGPAAALEHKERQRVLFSLLSKMKENRRTTFVLFEIEGLSGEEIAELHDVPVNTVWTRLYHARKEFFAAVARYQKSQNATPGR
jgi:RNA polymerase sigma-70 factor (ECF subfamily)